MKFYNLATTLIVTIITVLSSHMAMANSKRTDIISNDKLQARLIYTSLLTLNNANLTGNYTVLLDSAAPSFRAVNTSHRLTRIFAGFRKNAVDMGAIVLQNPVLTKDTQIDRNGVLHIEGFFPSMPLHINFKLSFQKISGAWRLYGISVKPSTGKLIMTSSLETTTKKR